MPHVFGKQECGFINEQWAYVYYVEYSQCFFIFPPYCGSFEYRLTPVYQDIPKG